MGVNTIALNISEALKLPILEKAKLIAGHEGIENQIKWVTIVEVLDDIERLQEGEFLITTGFNLMEDKGRMEIFHNLLQSKLLSGVAIYTSFYLKEIPESFINLANKHALPLIEIPIDINFSEITKVLLKKIVNKQTYMIEHSDMVHKQLTELILNDQSLTEVTKRLSQLTNSEIIVYDEFYRIIYTNNQLSKNERTTISNTILTLNQKQVDLTRYLIQSVEKEAIESIIIDENVITVCPIIAKQSCFGWIVMLKGELDWQEIDNFVIERATSIYAMEFLKNEAIEETKLRIQSNLLEDIFSNNYLNEKLIFDQGYKMNYDFSLNQCVYHLTFQDTIDINLHLIDRLYHMVEQLFLQKKKQLVIQTKLRSITLLTNVVGDTQKLQYENSIALGKEIQDEWSYYFPKSNLIIGIGKTYNKIKELGKSAKESQYASLLNELLDSPTNIIHYLDLGMYDLLLTMREAGIDLKTVYVDTIDKLKGDSGKEVDLIETLDVYFKNNQSIQHSSEKLFIHRHTLRYRLGQIEQRTGLNLKSNDDILKLQLGVMAYKLTNLFQKIN